MSNDFSPTRTLFRYSIFVSTAIALVLAAEARAKELVSDEISKLPQITVKEKALVNAGEVDGYKTGVSRSSTRTEKPLLDTPQSVSVVTQDQIRDQNISSIAETVRYVPGVSIHQGENNRDQVIIRGNSTSADFFIDGARDDVQYFRDVYNIDRVEVLKGPNAVAFGRGGSGGLINRVSKIADGTEIRQLVLSGGSYNNRRAQADIGDKINDQVLFRVNTMYEKSDTFRQYGDLERYGFNPTLTFNVSKKTNLKVGYEYFHDSRFNDRGIPSFNGAPYKTDPSTFFGDPTQNESDATVHSGYTTLTHDFSSDLQLRNYTRYTQNSKFYQNVYAGSAVSGAGTLTISAYNNEIQRNNFTNQTDLTKKFTTGSVKHTALIGAEITDQRSQAFRNTGYFNNSTTTVTVLANSPITLAPITYRQSASDANNHSEARVYAGYIQDQVDINKYLQLIGGLRYDSFTLDYHDNRSGLNLSRTDEMVSPRAAIVVKPKDNVSIYTSYSESFLPGAGDQFATLTVQTEALKPESLQNYEIGAKWDINPKLSLTTAIYQLNRTNTRSPDPSNPGYFLLTGETRINGFEFGATGKITDKWQIIGGYSYQDATVRNSIASGSTTIPAGNKVALVPQNMISIWNKYDFTKQWAAGLGIIDQTHQFAGADNTVKLKGFTRFDAAAYYTINPKYRLQLNVENLLNREYFSTADSNNNLQPGSPQAVKVSLIANF